MKYEVTRPHVDKDGNHVRVGQLLELSPDEAAIFIKRRHIMTPEDAAVWRKAIRERAKNVTYRFHHYERP